MAAISSFSSQTQLPASTANPGRGGRQQTGSCMMLEAAGGSVVVGITKSLTEEDLEELKGCLDLGFGFAYHEIPELCGTLPGLELCYSMTRRFLHEQKAPGQEEEPVVPPVLEDIWTW